MENVLQRNLRADRAGSAFLETSEKQILKIFPFDANHRGAFVGAMYLLVCPKNSGYATDYRCVEKDKLYVLLFEV